MAVTGRSVPSRVRSLRTFQAFHNRQFRLLWPANLFSHISRWSQMTLLAWLVLELTGSPWRVSLVGACGFAPTLMLGAIGGLLADRVDRKRLLTITQAANLIVTLVMTVVLFTGRVEFWHAYIVILANGTGWALDFPSRRSIVHDLMGRSGVTNAIAVDSIGMHTSRMVGPALAGLLIATVEVSGAYVVVTGFHLITLTLIGLFRLPERRVPSELIRSTGVVRNLAEGFRYVAGQRAILAAVVVTVLMNLLLFPYQQMVPVIAKNVLEVGPTLMGLLLATEGFGALIGAVGIASTPNITYHGRYFLGGSVPVAPGDTGVLGVRPLRAFPPHPADSRTGHVRVRDDAGHHRNPGRARGYAREVAGRDEPGDRREPVGRAAGSEGSAPRSARPRPSPSCRAPVSSWYAWSAC